MNTKTTKPLTCKIPHLLFGLAALGLLSVQPIQGRTVVNFDTPDADTFIEYGDPQRGSYTTIRSRFHANGKNREMPYIRFDLASLNGQTVSAAELTFYYDDESLGPRNGNMAVYALPVDFQGGGDILGQDWGENDLTWDNAPARADAAGFETLELLGTFAIDTSVLSGGQGLTFSGSNLVDFINTSLSSGEAFNTLVTFVLMDESPDGVGDAVNFASKEHAEYNPTALSLTVIPEPATAVSVLGLVALAFSVVLRQRRGRAS